MPPEEHEKAAALLACYGEKIDTANVEYMKQLNFTVDGEDLSKNIGSFKMRRRDDASGNLVDHFEIELFGHTPATVSKNPHGNHSRNWNMYLPDYQYGEIFNIEGFDYEFNSISGHRLVIHGRVERYGVAL